MRKSLVATAFVATALVMLVTTGAQAQWGRHRAYHPYHHHYYYHHYWRPWGPDWGPFFFDFWPRFFFGWDEPYYYGHRHYWGPRPYYGRHWRSHHGHYHA